MTQSQIMSQSMTDSMIQEVTAATQAEQLESPVKSAEKELNKLEAFIANEKHENEKENSIGANNGASEQPAENSDSNATPATRLESDLLIEHSIGHTNGHGNGTLEDKL